MDIEPICFNCKFYAKIELKNNPTLPFFYQCWLRPPRIWRMNETGQRWAIFQATKPLNACHRFATGKVDAEIINCTTCDNRKEHGSLECKFCEDARVNTNHFCSLWACEGQDLNSERAQELSNISGMDDIPF